MSVWFDQSIPSLRSVARPPIAGVLIVGLAGCGDDGPTGPDPEPPEDLNAEVVAEGLSQPVHLTSPPESGRLYVVERGGTIRVLEPDGTPLPDLFLDIRDRVGSDGGEQGLLSLAFHPEFPTSGRLFVYFTNRDGDTRVVRYETDPGNPASVDRSTGRTILSVDQPFSNHNGGFLDFGPDGMLWVGLGDGGSGGDPRGNGQDPGTLLGSLLRLDVDGGEPYAIPPGNPFAGSAEGRGEIWAYGLRNPWRFDIEEESGLLYIADVGQSEWEEVNVRPLGEAGVNYGWNVMEGRHCFQTDSCDRTGLTLPVLEYGHSEGCSVTGGHVYRGQDLPGLRGHYFYADFCAGWVRSFRYEDGEARDRREWDLPDMGQITSFGTDAAGELYVLSAGGTVYRLVSGS